MAANPGENVEHKTKESVEVTMKILREQIMGMKTELKRSSSTTTITLGGGGNNEECENRLKEANKRHRRDTEKRVQEFENTIQYLQDQLAEEIRRSNIAMGRLEECRTAKNQAFTDLAETRKFYDNKVKELEKCISAGRKELTLLQSEREKLAAETSRAKELEGTVEMLNSKIEILETAAQVREAELEAANSTGIKLKEEHEKLNEMFSTLQDKNKKLEADHDATLKEKLAITAEHLEQSEIKDAEINKLKGNVETLKETATVLDAQLANFQGIIEQKTGELEDNEKLRQFLETENKEIREELRQCRVELNETKSVNAYTEQCLKKTQSTLKSQNESKESEVSAMTDKLELLTLNNQELIGEVTELTNKISQLEAEKFELKKCVETSTSERDRYTRDLHALLKSVVHTKDANVKLTAELEKVTEEAKVFKDELEEQEFKVASLEKSMNIKEVLSNTRIQQQNKLIEHLNDKLSILQERLDKKKMRANLFTPKKPTKTVAPALPLMKEQVSPSTMMPVFVEERVGVGLTKQEDYEEEKTVNGQRL